MRQGRNDVLRGRRVLVTGAARGIGAETATRLVGRGARVSLVGLEPERLAALAGSLGPGAAWFEADVRDREGLDRAVRGTAERFGGLDAVVANAGIVRVGTVAGIEPEQFEEVIEVNLLGVWRTIRAALPEVVRNRGYVLTVASLAAAIHPPLMASYNAAKAGVSALADSLRAELRGTGTAVGVAYFGVIDTDMTRNAEADPITQAVRGSRRGLLSPMALSVESAGAAIVRGIERRSRVVVLPRIARPLLFAPEPFQRASDVVSRWLRVSEAAARVERGPDEAGG